MAQIVSVCPITHMPVPTGLGATQKAFETLAPDTTFHCRACGKDHPLTKENAILVDSPDDTGPRTRQ